jgi:hypothetical protein
LENEGQSADATAVGSGLKTGVTIDLSRKNIKHLPEEVVDILKDELERLALSHNQLSSLPSRFSECTSLRYLNIRGNQLKEFPMPLCDLKSLEILDLGRNQLRVLPPDIVRLTSLKVLSVPKNQIRELPLCLADMGSLQVLKFEENPISFPPRDALQSQASSPPQDGMPRESELSEVVITANIKKFLKQFAATGRMDGEYTGDESSEGADTPRLPLKRAASGRFPIKVNGTDVPDMRSPSGGARPPPIPTRSHYRGLSQQSTTIRRPGVMPLTIGNVNERLRSNSESILRTDRPESSRQRRMGIVSKRPSELGTLDETQANNRFSHYRGLSHGSAMQGTVLNSKSPATPTEQYPQRPIYVRRLSILPERRRESKIFDPVIEAAKGILYSVFQIHPMIQMLMSLTSDGSAKRSSLELVFYNTNSHVEELEQEIQKHDSALLEDNYSSRENENVHRACQTLVSAYGHVCTLLADNIDTFVNNGDARYIRTLLMLLYNSIMELRVTLSTVTAQAPPVQPPDTDFARSSDTIKPRLRQPPLTIQPVDNKPVIVAAPRSRSGTMAHNPSNLRVAVDPPSAFINGNGGRRTAALGSATPRSGESFGWSNDRSVDLDFSDEDAQFEKIFLSLQKSADVVLRTLPNFNMQLAGGLRNAMNQGAPSGLVRDWKRLVAMCNDAIQQTEFLKDRLSVMKLKEPGVRTQGNFWQLCNNFILSWTNLVTDIKYGITNIPLPMDTRVRLRPIQRSMKETSNTIMQSPWSHLFISSENGNSGALFNTSVPPTPQLPITPQTAALGPAMQATVPTTPQSASFASAFHGSVFDRADALMANPGISMSHSRSSTMSRGHSGLNSLSSISSMSSDGFNPNGPLGPAPLRLNGGRVLMG